MRITFSRLPRAAARGVRSAVLAAVVLAAGAVPALAVSTRDLVALAQGGLSDDVLVALVEADGTEFALDAAQILELRRQGVSERVILAMLRNSRRAAPARDDAPQPAVDVVPAADPPSLVIIGEKPAPAIVEQTTVFVVPYVPVVVGGPVVPVVGPVAPGHTRPAGGIPGYRGFGRFINNGWVDGKSPSGLR